MKRDVKIYGLYLVAIVAISMFAGCVAKGISDPTDPTEISFEDIAIGNNSGLRERGTYVIRNESDWNSFMDNFCCLSSENPNLVIPDILYHLDKPDLSGKTVIALAMGEKNTGGYSIHVKEILEFDDRIEVHFEEVSPAKDGMVTMGLTQPYHIVSIESTEKPVVFEMI